MQNTEQRGRLSPKRLEFCVSFNQGLLSHPVEPYGQLDVVAHAFAIQYDPITELSVPDAHTRLQGRESGPWFAACVPALRVPVRTVLCARFARSAGSIQDRPSPGVSSSDRYCSRWS